MGFVSKSRIAALEAKLRELEDKFSKNIKDELKAKAVEIDAAINSAKDNFFDEFEALPMTGGKLGRLFSRLRLMLKLRRRAFDLGVVLMPPYPPLTMTLVNRFTLYLKLFGVKRIIAQTEILNFNEKHLNVVYATLQVLSPLKSR